MAKDLTVLDNINRTITPVMERVTKISQDLADITNEFMPKFKNALKSDVFQEDPDLALKAFHEINAAQTNALQFSRQLVDSLVKAKQVLDGEPDSKKDAYEAPAIDNEVTDPTVEATLFDN